MNRSTSTKLFSEKAGDYAKYRPAYGKKTIDTILSPFQADQSVQAVDVGSGTGIGSRLLADNGCRVVSIEPNEKMIYSAEAHPKVTYKNSTAENIPLSGNYADLITCFQAFHWFNFKQSLAEFQRVLKHTGQLAIIWSYWNRKDSFTNEYVKLIHEATRKNKDRTEPYEGLTGRIKKMRVRCLWKLHYLPYFKNVRHHRYKHIQKLDLAGLIGCAKSQSFILHEGPHWDTLVHKLEELEKDTAATSLVYDVHLFTATPLR